MSRFIFVGLAVLGLTIGMSVAASSSPVGKIGYNEHIQPILAENCFACHGPDSSARKGELRLDRVEFATAQRGDHDPAIVPGDPKASLLVERITSTDEDERMPPLESHKQLKPSEIALLQRVWGWRAGSLRRKIR